MISVCLITLESLFSYPALEYSRIAAFVQVMFVTLNFMRKLLEPNL